MNARRLTRGDSAMGKGLFLMMAEVFGEQAEEASDSYVDALLSDPRFWAVAAFVDGEPVGGATAHEIPLTHRRTSALFVYDLAVRADHQRRGIGRELMRVMRAEAALAGIDELFVLADDEDSHALDFYRALGATPHPVTMFELEPRGD